MKLYPIIGLEIHVQLKTKTKLFCSCSNDAQNAKPNTLICPICLGHPGVLPVMNRDALAFAAKAGLALGCEIQDFSKFDRKNYFYPDLPKGYQISQYEKPIALSGKFEITHNKKKTAIRINRIHMEEDAAKNIHSGTDTLIDYNRGGTPLIEIVTEPDFRAPAEAKVFLQDLQRIMRYLEISDADMEKGNLRCDANISLSNQPIDLVKEYSSLSPKTEIKNLNSFKAVERSLEYEIQRQSKLWHEGKPPSQQSTRGWDEDKGKTVLQREKEIEADYRYFPEPDLPPVDLSLDSAPIKVKTIMASLPELPAAKRNRFAKQYGISLDNAKTLVASKALANFFEQVVSELREWLSQHDEICGPEEETLNKHCIQVAKLASNWMLNKYLRLLDDRGISLSDSKINPENLAEFITLVYTKQLNSAAAQKVLEEMVATGKDPSHIMEEQSLSQIESEEELAEVVQSIIDSNERQVEQYKAGKETVLKFFVGQVMRETKGAASPQVVEKMLKQLLKN
ncbi:MAG: Asp-tRNA(Asn)/Glu-tRNA(Gln) amidotransferase subunit GatB [Candidatus Buchananbacteria bacterium CG10_big_fil_rev_8_21_14_0_10_42_9]|uniref:Aspartyl/glutamyl-tRNA(Asn/Gln) amidotransferase subunit B n=1 Tax=Candidatus Buchananbacteria bacterium CG10_big_fil_rev_8_21_14_0_10_42_9 TaxID=1974526 RepID=A0A2H0W2U5_9BACT|nr:MAG: Asp-tRNA(Asn)/Glu-tRNA(Gln) amidotransferase subunit GatB [Candidatus Buchananbacteria bacterium CG10_big_fil_rev_8_21_14_0_10_42_9]